MNETQPHPKMRAVTRREPAKTQDYVAAPELINHLDQNLEEEGGRYDAHDQSLQKLLWGVALRWFLNA